MQRDWPGGLLWRGHAPGIRRIRVASLWALLRGLACCSLVGFSCSSGTTTPEDDGKGPLLPDSRMIDRMGGKDGTGLDSTTGDLDLGGEADVVGPGPGCGAGGFQCGTWVLDGAAVHCGVCPGSKNGMGRGEANGEGNERDDHGEPEKEGGNGPFCSGEGMCGPVPDCGVDQLRVTELLMGGNADALAVPSVGPVQPGTPVPFVLGWKAGNSDGCPGCEREIAVGVESRLPVCVGAGEPAPCPGMATGHSIGKLVAPEEPGTYVLLAELTLQSGCESETHEFGTDFTAQIVGTLVVGEPCIPVDCKGLDASCGLLDDACGGKVWCGACGAGEMCTDSGQCETAPACALDILEVNDVFINGFSNAAQVAAGDPVLLMFSYLLGSKEVLDGVARQVVLGAGDLAVACIDVGVPPTCPGTAPGLGSAKFEAPTTGGIHPVNLVVTAEDDCALATAAYAGATPKMAIGMLDVIGGCLPETCTELGAQCGYLNDGCGGHVSCGACPGGQVCHLLAVCGPPDCGKGMFALLNAQVGGPGTTTSTAPGGLVPVALTFNAGSGAECASCPTQLVLGFQGASAGCVDLGVLPECPQSAPGSIGSFIKAPQSPGEHTLLAAMFHEGDCDEAEVTFGQDAWKTVAVPIGTVNVEGSCLPVGCSAIGKECGEWGDGCGGILHCGMCAEGTTCTGQGQCDSPCKEGVFEVTGIGIAGSGKAGSAPAGKVTSVSINWELSNPEGCSNCKRQIVVGIDDEAQFCAEGNIPPACPKVGAGAKTGTVVAPEQEGIHTVYALAETAGSCLEAMEKYAKNPARKAVGTLYSVIGCTPASCAQQGTSCGPKVDFCGQTLDCGTCPPGLLCMPVGKCQCSAQDPYEPNNAPAQAFHVGDFTDKDVESMTHIEAALENEEDWFSVGAGDVQWAFMEPFVEVSPGLDQPFEVVMAYVCLSGATPADYTLVDGLGCKPEADLGVELPGATGPSAGFRCTGNGDTVFVQFGPQCPGVNDSGTLYVGVKKTGQCSAYELNLHL